ncbi:MAG: tetracycline regulation of excision, RteC, partial [Verrucomicrobiaceae bacterium]
MIQTIYKEALRSIRAAEKEITFEPATTIEESYQMTIVLRDLLSKMKEHVLDNGFQDATEEIEFFKNIKPQILGKLIYYNKVFRIESACPVGGGKLYHKYFSNELDQLKQEYKGHIYNTDFYRYYRLGRTDWDHNFFQLGKIDLHNGVNSFVFEIDTHFSTYYDYKAARIIASELLYNYLLSRLEPDEPENIFLPEGNGRDFFWSDSKNALIELIYALHASGSISNG